MRQATIKDIARELSLSVATVSRALRNTHDVSRTTRDRVLAMAAQLKYRPNPYAVGLAGGKSGNIGVILPFVNNYYFSTVITGIQEVAYANAFNVILFITNDSPEREIQILKGINGLHLDGLLISVSSDSSSISIFNDLMDDGTPVVFFDRVVTGVNASKVMQDDYQGACEAVAHLIAQGYQNIAHIAGYAHLEFTEQRLKGYLDTLNRHGRSANYDWVIHSGFSQDDGFRDMERLLAFSRVPDAVFAVNDRKAIGAMLALKKHGIAIGSEIGVIGFTDDPTAQIISPSLSTVAEPAREIGKQACDLLINHISRESFQPRDLVLSGKLIVRDSTLRRSRLSAQ